MTFTDGFMSYTRADWLKRNCKSHSQKICQERHSDLVLHNTGSLNLLISCCWAPVAVGAAAPPAFLVITICLWLMQMCRAFICNAERPSDIFRLCYDFIQVWIITCESSLVLTNWKQTTSLQALTVFDCSSCWTWIVPESVKTHRIPSLAIIGFLRPVSTCRDEWLYGQDMKD